MGTKIVKRKRILPGVVKIDYRTADRDWSDSLDKAAEFPCYTADAIAKTMGRQFTGMEFVALTKAEGKAARTETA